MKWLLAAGVAAVLNGCAAARSDFEMDRRAMVEEINAERTGMPGRFGEAVNNAMLRVPRHLFVPGELERNAYENVPLPIGHGQTISQPYIVALMTDLLALRKEHRVLEIGTGSGYQAAVLSEIVARVFTIEIVAALAADARERLGKLGYRNVEVRTGDGYRGWPEEAPFDAIMVTAGADQVPAPLVEQLKAGGRMVIPVGAGIMQLTLIEKLADGTIRRRDVIPVRFVPFTREP